MNNNIQQKKNINKDFFKVLSERQQRIVEDGIKPVNVSSSLIKDMELSKTIEKSELILEKLRCFR